MSASTTSSPSSSSVVFPTWFLGHGAGPCFFLDGNEHPMLAGMDKHSKITQWLSNAATELGFVPGGKYGKPKSLLIISGHWESDEFDSFGKPVITVTSQKHHSSLLYDYYGMPAESYDLKYPAPGNPELASQIISLLQSAGISAKADHTRNLDHGVFIPMKLIFPEADIPIVQLSISSSLSPQFHLALGAALTPLRSSGVLIIGSGLIAHGPDVLFGGKKKMSQFIDTIEEILTDGGKKKRTEEERMKDASEWKKFPQARAAHPREDHLVPLYVVLGAAQGKPARSLLADAYFGKQMWIPMHNYLFDERN